MDVYYKKDVERCSDEIIDRIKKGDVFIYPTDTIYGIGCDARNMEAVLRIREIKQRFNKPFSVIVPDKQWIKDYCYLDKKSEFWLKKLPGPYTFILKMKDNGVVCDGVALDDKLGVRIPDVDLMSVFNRLDFPIITTSVNVVSYEPLKDPMELSVLLKEKIDFVINKGAMRGVASTIIDLSGEKPNIIR